MEEVRILSNSPYDISITLIPTLDKERTTTKTMLIFIYDECKCKTLNKENETAHYNQ